MKRVVITLLLVASMPIGVPAQSGVRGTVLDSDGRPLVGVRVYVGSHFAVTDSMGTFVVEDLPAGRYAIGTHPTGYRVWASEVALSGEGPFLDQIIVAEVPREFSRVCDDMVMPGLRVEIVDSITGAIVEAPATVTAARGDSIVRLRLGLDDWQGRRVIGYFGLGGSGGTYDIEVHVEGYRPWRREQVEVPTTGCGKLDRTEVRALLQPPSAS